MTESWSRVTQRGGRLIPILRAAARGRQDLALAALDGADISWAIETGLGPLLFHVTSGYPGRAASPLWPRLQSAHLTARLLTLNHLDAMAEILDACDRDGVHVVLLKGISICQQHYPEPFLRPMRDIDFLVREHGLPAAEAVLVALGYQQQSQAAPGFYDTHHHGVPFFDPRRGVWVEVHHRLSSPKAGQAVEDVLGPARVQANLEPVEFLGRKAARLSNELQLVYIASHWARQLHVVGGAIALLDMIYLLKGAAGTLRWETILAWLHGAPAAAAALYALLSYLDGRGLVRLPPGILRELRMRQRSFGPLNLRIIHAMIDRFLLTGPPRGRLLGLGRLRIVWNTLFLPNPPLRNLARLPRNILAGRIA